MLRTILIVAALSLLGSTLYCQTKVGGNVLDIDPASILELESTSQGFLPSRMTTTQRDAQSDWDRAHIIYNTTDNCLQIYTGSTWECILQGEQVDSSIYKYDGQLISDRSISMNGSDLSFDGSGDTVIITADGRVGIGDLTPDAKLDVENGTVQFSDYGSGTISGSETYLLGVDSEGRVIEVSSDDTDVQRIDTLFIRNDSLFISLERDGEPEIGVSLGDYIDTDDQTIDEFLINGTNQLLLSIEDDGEAALSVDLTPYLNTDGQILDTFRLQGTDLQMSLSGDSVPALTLDLSSLTDADWLAIDGNRATSINDSIYTLGQVGIGTTSPAGKLHVSTEGSEDILFTRFDNDPSNDLDLDFIGGQGTSSSPSPLSGTSNGNRMGGIRFRTYIDPGSFFTNPLDAFAPIAEIAGETDGVYSPSTGPGKLIFSTTAQGNNRPSERMVIKSDGKVGIGITAPDELLHIGGNMRLNGAFEDKDGDAGTTGQILTSTVTGTDWVDSSTIGTDDQNLSNGGKSGNDQTINIESGDAVTFSVADADSSITNEIQDLTLTGNTLAISNDPNTDVDLAPYLDNTNLSQEQVQDFVGPMVTGNTETGITVTYDDANDQFDFVAADPSATNEIQVIDSFGLTGNTLAISLSDDGVAPLTVDLSTITGSSDNIYNTDGSLDAARTVDLNANNLTFDGTDDGDVIIQSDGDVGIGTVSPSGDLEVRSDENQDAFYFLQEDGTTGEKDVFTIEDQDVGGGGQDESSVLKVVKSGPINSGDDGFSLVELANTGTDPGDNKYWISGRKTDEGAPLWGVDITDNDYWSEGGIILGVTGADGGTYSGGTFRVEADGDVGIGTTTPAARLEVDGGSVRLSDYGANTYVDTSVSTLLTVQPDGDVRELNTAKNTRWFYPPAVVIDASSLDTMATIDLHADYVDQFGSPLISSDGASGYVPYYQQDELEYYVTDYDTTVLGNVSIDADGVMTYDVISVPFDNYTVINVVFVIKDP